MNSNIKLSETAVRFFAVLICFLSLPIMGFAGEITTGSEMPDKQVSLIYPYQTSDMSLYEYKKDRVMLIAFVPSVSKLNDYADIMTSAFDAYFAEGLSFGHNVNKAYEELSVAVVSYESPEELANYSMQMDFNFPLICDKNQAVTNAFGIEEFKGDNGSAKVYIVGKDNKVVYAEEYYRGEGEKLKAVEKKLFEMLAIPAVEYTDERYSTLMTGDEARDFAFEYVNMGKDGYSTETGHSTGSLSEFKGKNILLGFYPAAFSYSCSGEIISYDDMITEYSAPENNSAGTESFKDLEVLMVSSGNTALLQRWMNAMNFGNVKLVSDSDAQIAAKYNSFYFEMGYNQRTIFLIDKDGKIAYIDWDYKVNDEDLAILKNEIRKLN